MMHRLRQDIANAITANEAARFPATREGSARRFILAGLTDQLRTLLAALDRDIALPCGGQFGTNGRWETREAGIRDLIRRSERERKEVRAPRPSADRVLALRAEPPAASHRFALRPHGAGEMA